MDVVEVSVYVCEVRKVVVCHDTQHMILCRRYTAVHGTDIVVIMTPFEKKRGRTSQKQFVLAGGTTAVGVGDRGSKLRNALLFDVYIFATWSQTLLYFVPYKHPRPPAHANKNIHSRCRFFLRVVIVLGPRMVAMASQASNGSKATNR